MPQSSQLFDSGLINQEFEKQTFSNPNQIRDGMIRNSLDAINNQDSGLPPSNMKKSYLDRSIDMQTTIDTGYNTNQRNNRREAAGTVLSFQQKNMMQRFSSQLNSISPGDNDPAYQGISEQL